VLQQLDVEVDQEGVTQTGQLQIGKRLRGMNRQKTLDALEFDQNQIVDDEIDPVSGFDSQAFEINRQVNLPLEGNASKPELVAEAAIVSGLEQTWPQDPMNVGRESEYPADDRTLLEWHERHRCNRIANGAARSGRVSSVLGGWIAGFAAKSLCNCYISYTHYM
jgi:hypothetical protein